jgi:hypothetical protein
MISEKFAAAAASLAAAATALAAGKAIDTAITLALAPVKRAAHQPGRPLLIWFGVTANCCGGWKAFAGTALALARCYAGPAPACKRFVAITDDMEARVLNATGFCQRKPHNGTAACGNVGSRQFIDHRDGGGREGLGLHSLAIPSRRCSTMKMC